VGWIREAKKTFKKDYYKIQEGEIEEVTDLCEDNNDTIFF